MAAVKQTRSGNWFAVNEVNGNIINGQPRDGFNSRRGAKEWAKRNLDAITSVSQVETF